MQPEIPKGPRCKSTCRATCLLSPAFLGPVSPHLETNSQLQQQSVSRVQSKGGLCGSGVSKGLPEQTQGP